MITADREGLTDLISVTLVLLLWLNELNTVSEKYLQIGQKVVVGRKLLLQ